MKRIINKFNHLKITSKVTFTVFIFAFIPIAILFIVVISNMRESAVNDKINLVKYSIEQNYSHLQKSVELCNMSTQVLLNNTNLLKFLEKIKSGEKLELSDKMNFYRNEIASIERLINSNLYLYQIHIYVDNDTIEEMMPVLYHKNRMRLLEWGKDDIVSGTWQFDYTNETFPNAMNPAKHIMSLVTVIPNYTYGNLGIIEVAIRMNNIFPSLYDTKETSWSCFVDGKNNKYYDDSENNRFNSDIDDVFKCIDMKSVSDQYLVTRINKEDVLIAYKPIVELGGCFIQVVSLKDIMQKVSLLRNQYVIYLVIVMIALFLAIHLIVYAMSKRFYLIYQTLNEVQNGNLDVQIPVYGTDEIGELANRINIMLKKIMELMENNMKREMLKKNSEIRALQNQINAHFIYNVLESIKMMAEIDGYYDISDSITSLGYLLRYSMKGLSKNVTVKEEIEYIKKYIALMNLRYDYEIYLSLNIPDILWEEEIPKMSLQPIIENAICHGVEDIAEDTNIYVKGIVKQTYFIIEVSDQGKGIKEDELEELLKRIEGEVETSGGSGTGIGLKNVQDRIKMNFGEKYGITISSKYGCYTKVSIKIPKNLGE